MDDGRETNLNFDEETLIESSSSINAVRHNGARTV